ncbi:uncharacterized protein EI97DRAFT_43866 [Westerdykella ornata]|uniref:histone acetyltransferase n=1 Tax=Westerdykella ornata TaxID=318751 RepID=A0A6A6JJC1_WESOR|nr:uncharacterized protein EI97DRAFT_43866 [Westerdykella ornata]KAF2276552.1 hypothetical protein EI97DRAFT_43866 [Westerdykella ornata]
MASISHSKSLQDLLSEALPKDVPFTFYHYSTPPTKSTPLFSAPPHHKSERTYRESHFLAVSIVRKSQSPSEVPEELLILAIEVLIYTTENLTTIFISKADSTGYIAELSLPRAQAGSPLKSICGIFVSWLARERRREGKKLVISLFARAQDQYLFPASVENPNKHVLDDRGLIKWWCKVLDPLIREHKVEEDAKNLTERLAQSKNGKENVKSLKSEYTAKGYLVIPGFDAYDTLRYTPLPSSSGPRRWVASHPLLKIAPHPGAPPRCLVPHFPDDPKSRFLDELDEELPDARTEEMSQLGGTPSRSNGQWKSVKTLDQFWEMMAFRQECSSGRITGFIWVVITPPQPSIPEEDESEEPSQTQTVNDSQDSPAIHQSPARSKASPRKPRRRKVNTSHGPIPIILPKIKSSVSNMSGVSTGSGGTATKLPPEVTPYYKWPSTSRGTLLLSSTAYDRAHEIITQQNFATHTAAARSTKRWKDEVALLGGGDDWSWTIVGQKEGTPSATPGYTDAAAPMAIIGARKKRKPENGKEAESNETTSTAANVLGGGLVRKKAKVDETGSNVPTPEPASKVNTLGTGLVRKKTKA